MDTLTHALSGVLLARATAPRQGALRGRLLVGGAAAAFPDIDVLLTLVSPIAYLTQHRGVTHSLLLLPLWAWVIGGLAARIGQAPEARRAFVAAAALGLGIHIAGDLITSFGTMILAPLSDRRFALDTTFIIDPWLSGIIVVGLAASALARRSRVPAVAACVALAGYVGLQWTQRAEAIAVGEAYARERGLSAVGVEALPRPPTPFNWTVIVSHGHAYDYAHVDLSARRAPAPASADAGFIARVRAAFQPPALAQWQRETRLGTDAQQARLARIAWSQDVFAFYRWFAAYPALLAVRHGNPSTCVWFRDLRFVMPGRPEPFRYGLCSDEGGPWQAYELLPEGDRRPLDRSRAGREMTQWTPAPQ